MATFTGTADADTFTGGPDDDIFIVDNAGDVVIEALDGGIDTVRASLNHTLRNNVEDLILLGSAIKGTGNALANHITGTSGTNFIDGRGGVDTMEGGAGNDTYFVDTADDAIIEEAAGGYDRVQSRSDYTLSANIEQLILLGANALHGTGNAGANVLTGNAFDNVLDGGAGADSLRGGAGDDTYVVDSKFDKIVELAGRGTDTVMASASYALAANVENLVLTGAAISATGNTADNHLTGSDGNNVLDGGAGADVMAGGAGDDTYRVDNAGDVIDEAAGGGIDTVKTALGHVLAANVENLLLEGTAAVDGTGNALDNVLTGNGAANRLDGGEGADNLRGGKGDDVYIVDNAGDQVVELARSGFDKVESSISWTLSAHVEQLTLTGSALNATGNADANVLIGTDAANVLDGGAGGDAMVGGKGDDVYVVDSTFDRIEEGTDGGIDTVRSSSAYHFLDDNVENLILTGIGDIQGAGNALNNVITGNSGNNALTGRGGHDTLIGGAGDDRYLIYSADHTLVEQADGGTDLVYLIGSWDSRAALAENIENVTAHPFDSFNQSLIGNALNNTLTGNYTVNYIDGGLGADTMAGGLGSDTYVVDNAGDVIIEAYGNYGTDKVIANSSYALQMELEDLTLVGPNALNGTGNLAINVITGNEFDNILDGKFNDDTMIGGAGNDTYHISSLADSVVENQDEGHDTVVCDFGVYGSYTMADNVEDTALVAKAALSEIFGNALDNAITGNELASRIDGGLGADVMTGGGGDDVYVIDNAGDRAVELVGGGTDGVETGLSFTLVANIENLTLTGAAAVDGTGNVLANTITGNDAVNHIAGLAGDDILAGGGGGDSIAGGDGGDHLSGGDGNDTLIGDAGDDTIDGGAGVDKISGGAGGDVLSGDEGADSVTGGDGIDHLSGGDGDDILTGDGGNDVVDGGFGADKLSGGLGDDSLSGGEDADTLTGDAGNDRLDGGFANDTMSGGLGDDVYIVDSPVDAVIAGSGDVVTERADEGTDTVNSSVSWTLSANVENLTLTGQGGYNGTGNAGDNTIIGNDFDNVLAGGGGTDRLIGGLGNDTYLVDGTGVTVVEQDGGGTDRMVFAANGTMGANVEIGVVGGSGSTGITGSATGNLIGGNAAGNVLDGAGGNDSLFGQAGADTLKGGDGNDFLFGGADVDTLTGGAGSDQFAIGTGGGQGVDKITDFVSGTDTLLVVNDFVSGYLLAGGFVNGTSARDQDDIAIYDKGSGNLYVDYDANGPQAKVLLASFTPGTVLAASDIQLITVGEFNAQVTNAELALLI